MALGLIGCMGHFFGKPLDKCMFLGESSLDGSVGSARGALSAALAAREFGSKAMAVPESNAREAAVVEGVDVFTLQSLPQAVDLLNAPKSFQVSNFGPVVLGLAVVSRGRWPPCSIDSLSPYVLPIVRTKTPNWNVGDLSRMTAETKHLEVTLETQVESVNVAEEMCLRVAESAGFGEDDCYRIGMSVREGVINAFHYGNQERPEKKIHLVVDITPEKMIIKVLDEGKGFDLSQVPDPLAQENLLSTSGRGIFLMRAFMDEFDVVPGRTGGAEIIMSKRLPTGNSSSTNDQGGQDAAPPQRA